MGLKKRFSDWLLGTPEMVWSGSQGSFTFQNKFNEGDSVAVATTCVKILAETLGTMPLNVYRDDKKDGKVKDKRSNLWELLHYQPNPYTNSNSFFQTLEYHRNFKGNAFAQIHRTEGSGKPLSFEIISPSRVKDYEIKKNELYYVVKSNIKGEDNYLVNSSDMLHFKMMSPDGIMGINPISALSLNLGTTYKGMRTMDSFYANNALSPKALKTVVGSMNATRSKEAMAAFNKEYAGAANAGKWINLPPNTEIQDLQINFADAQIIDSMRFNGQQISALYGVPVYMAMGDYTQSKYNNIEQAQLSYKINTVMPISKMYKAELESKLLTTKQRRLGAEIEFNLNSLVEPDTKTKSEYYRSLANIGVITPKQIATFEGLPTDDVQDIHLVMSNIMALDKLSQPVETKPEPKEEIKE